MGFYRKVNMNTTAGVSEVQLGSPIGSYNGLLNSGAFLHFIDQYRLDGTRQPNPISI